MSSANNRRPQKPKVRNFVVKHAKDFARAAGYHRDPRVDYIRRARHTPGRAVLSLNDQIEDDDFSNDR